MSRDNQTACDCVELRCAMIPDGVNKCNKFMGYLGIKASNDSSKWNTDVDKTVEFLESKNMFPICRDCSAHAINAKIMSDKR